MAGIKRSEMVVRKMKVPPKPGRPIIVMSISGGKDSLAMWISLWKRGTPNLIPVYFNAGWEWESIKPEIRRIERLTGIKCHEINPRGLFDSYLVKRGWPSWRIKWCSGLKRDYINKFINSFKRGHPGFVVKSAVGMCFDEVSRIKQEGMKRKIIILPLVEMRIKERQSLRICGRAGCTWGGHYLRHDRLSCWCCPWQKGEDLKELYGYNQDKWKQFRAMDKTARRGRKFRWAGKSLAELEKRFARELKRGII